MPFYVVRSESADEMQTIAMWELESWQESDQGIAFASDERVASVHADKADALAVRLPNQTIVFRATDKQQREWQARERDRFHDGTYAHVPWFSSWWFDALWSRHFTHMSTVHPGLIAYTPDDDHGMRDRQVRTTVQKYFAKFLPGIDGVTREQIDVWSCMVKAFDGKLKIATTAEDIVNVYTHGPDSCMAHKAHAYACKPHHPCEVYGDSDLGVAYLGDPAHGVSARAIVWMEKKLYGRIYGDETIGHVLKAAGYTQSSWFDGAKVRAMVDGRDRWIMPYTDIACSANLSRDREWFVLSARENNDSGTRDTNGLLYVEDCDDDDEDDATDCERCGEHNCFGTNECDDCRSRRWRCSDCRSWFYDDNLGNDDSQEPERVRDHNGNYRNLCSDCLESASAVCDVCDETFYPEVQFSAEANIDRHSRHVQALCGACELTHAYCVPCEWYYKHDGSDVHCTHAVPIDPTKVVPGIVTTANIGDEMISRITSAPIIVDPSDGVAYTLHVDNWGDGEIIRRRADPISDVEITLTGNDDHVRILRSVWSAREVVGTWIPSWAFTDDQHIRSRYPEPYRDVPAVVEVSCVR